MDNSDSRYGFKPVGMLNGAALPPLMSVEHTTGTAVFEGDLCKYSGGNVISCTAATDVADFIAAEYVASTEATGTKFNVYPFVPGMILEAQVDDGTLADSSSNGSLLDFVLTHTGSTTTGLSGMEIDGNASVRDSFRLLDIVDRPDNAWGTNVKVQVTPMVTGFTTSRTITA